MSYTCIMLDSFKKQPKLIGHQFKNLFIQLPSNWEYGIEAGDQEACFDPDAQSTLRFHIIKAVSLTEITTLEKIKSLTLNQPYIVTKNGLLLTEPVYEATTEDTIDITLITWMLINYESIEKIITVATYTVLSAEKDSKREKDVIDLIEKSLRNSELR